MAVFHAAQKYDVTQTAASGGLRLFIGRIAADLPKSGGSALGFFSAVSLMIAGLGIRLLGDLNFEVEESQTGLPVEP